MVNAIVCHSVSQSIPFCAYIFTCNESLQVWFEASGFCYTISTGNSLGFLLNILFLPCVLDLYDQSLHVILQFINGVDVEVGHFKALICA